MLLESQLRHYPAKTKTESKKKCIYPEERIVRMVTIDPSPDLIRSELPPRLFASSLGGVFLLRQIGKPLCLFKKKMVFRVARMENWGKFFEKLYFCAHTTTNHGNSAGQVANHTH